MISAALLLYTCVPNMLERRAPYRPDHLALFTELHEAGRARFGGAFGDPISGAAFGFDSVATAEEFVARDPYVAAGLVVEHRIEPWTIVIGG